MTIPYMREYVNGAVRDPVEVEIGRLYGSLGWIFRALDEIVADAQLDKGKVEWLMTHCPLYRFTYAKLAARIGREGVSPDPDWPTTRVAGEVATIVRGYFQAKKMLWGTQAAMLTDLGLINTDALTIYNWIDVNVPSWKTGVASREIIGIAQDGSPIRQDVTAKIALTPDILAAVQTLRNRFAASPG